MVADSVCVSVGFGGDLAMKQSRFAAVEWIAQVHANFAEFEESVAEQGGVGVAV